MLQNTCNKKTRIRRKEKKIYIKACSTYVVLRNSHIQMILSAKRYIFLRSYRKLISTWSFPMQMSNWIFYIFSDTFWFLRICESMYSVHQLAWLSDVMMFWDHIAVANYALSIKLRLVVPNPLLIRSSLLERVRKKLWWITSALSRRQGLQVLNFARWNHARKIFLFEAVFVSASDGISCIIAIRRKIYNI